MNPTPTETTTASSKPEADSLRNGDLTLGGSTAEDIYNRENTRRDLLLDRAREVAEVTIPSLVPPIGYDIGDKLYTPHQGIGARGVNNIASRLLLTLMPPERPLFKHEIPADLIEEMKAEDKAVYGKVVLALSKRALRVTARADTTPLRATVYQALRLLSVAGNCLFQYEELDAPSVHGMERYITKRDNKGRPLLSILMEDVGWASLPDVVRSSIMKGGEGGDLKEKPEWERTVPVYTVCKLVVTGKGKRAKQQWVKWQEVFGKIIPNSEGRYPLEAPPLYPMWMVPAYGFDWGRAYADEYIGDLISVENKSKAVDEGAAAAALSLLFVKPGSRTRLDQVKAAKNLDVMSGDASDLTMFRTDKQGDFRFVLEATQATEKRLEFAFLLNSAIQRNGERVTAEEIKLMAKELDEAMGGIYAIFSQTIQRFIVNRLVYMMEKTGELPKVPMPEGQGALRVKVVTGLDALGQSREAELLDEFMEPLLNIPPALERIELSDYMRRKAAFLGIDPQGLVKEDEQVSQEGAAGEQKMMQKTMIEKGVGPAITAAGQMGAKAAGGPGGLDPAALAQALPPDMMAQMGNMVPPTQ